jgi:site-specific recombinase XerD
MKALIEYIEFCRSVRKLSPKTVAEYDRALKYLSTKIDILGVGNGLAIDEKLTELSRSENWSDAYVYRFTRILKKFYEWAHYKGHVKENPYVYSSIRRPRGTEPHYLTQEEFDFILDHRTHLTHQDLTLVSLLWDSGIRREEASLLNRRPVEKDLEDSVIHITSEASKGGYSGRFVPVSDRTRSLILDHIKMTENHTAESLFLSPDFSRMMPNDISKRMTRIAKVVPFPKQTKTHPHAFRHSLAIRLIEAGAGDLEVMKILGHSSLEMTTIYTHMSRINAKNTASKYLQTA